MSRIRNRFLDNTQWLFIFDNILFSHAGVSAIWLQNSIEPIMKKRCDDLKLVLEYVNNVEPCEAFGFIPDSPFDYYGESTTQPLTWIRPDPLDQCAITGFTQVVGHTPVENITSIKTISGDDTIWLCDCLENRQYLIIEDKKFSTHIYEESNESIC